MNALKAGLTTEPLGVLQVSTYDIIGGAERVAWNLFQTYRKRGYASWLAVGTKLGTDPDVLLIPNHGRGGRLIRHHTATPSGSRSAEPQGSTISWLSAVTRVMANPAKALDRKSVV